MGELHIGTSGFSYKDWKGLFYPQKLPAAEWLSFYAQHYDTVEINATFYRYFERSTFAKWRDQTPADFRFTLKAPREITHVRRLHDIDQPLEHFTDSIVDLRAKIAVLLWQFPPSFKYDDAAALETLTAFLRRLPDDYQQVVEFRHQSWFKEEVYDALNRAAAGFVINDSSRFPAAEVITGALPYLRFHGPTRLYASSYDTAALKRWAAKINAWLQRTDVFVYFNNDYDGRAIRNADELKQLLADVGTAGAAT
ncbi:MAG: DUF72 domain-containing protein [Anaerolineae bacterium]|nr:DUF72 domain-containing protein [Anaerolineae bacterium]